MLNYIINSGLCLAIFYGFYKIFLENDKYHFLKRFYLLGMILLSFGIPFITFTTYIEVESQTFVESTAEEFSFIDTNSDIMLPTIETNYTPIILWTIYLLGVILLSIQFFYNILHIYFRIKGNEHRQYKKFTHVLLREMVAPHTFFNYIFFNKTKFELEQIPKEVHLHEQAHADQKHSLDILFIEILKVVLWFNPLIYFIKHSIKLNHEFLADQAVLNDGITTSNYQQILLSFTSNKTHTPLANAINYSSIKKRFTVMKTPTSKNKLWVKSILILPLIAMLLFAFSQKETVEEEVIQVQSQNKTIEILINKNGDYLIDGEYSNIEKFTKRIEGYSPEEISALDVNIKASDKAPIGKVEAVKTMLNKNKVSKVNFEIHNESPPNQNTSQKVLDPEGDIPFANLNEYPIYPECSGDKETIRKCFHKSMQMHVNRTFNLDLAGNLGLSPGKKKIYSLLKITKTGKIEVIKSRSPHKALDEEMKRVVNLYPKVTPGKYKGEFVDATYMMPVTFNVE